MPAPRGGGNGKYPFEVMEVGHSFFVPGKKPEQVSTQAQASRPHRAQLCQAQRG
jgi:hypothetical protein